MPNDPAPPPPADSSATPRVSGWILPHGVLIAIDAERLTITACSANAASLLALAPDELLGRDAADLPLPGLDTLMADLRSQPGGARARGWATALPAPDGASLAATLHEHDGHLLLELERLPDRLEGRLAGLVQNNLRLDLEAIRDAATLNDLAMRAAQTVRRLTGFDRVAVLRFGAEGGAEGDAERLAEAVGDGAPSDAPPRFDTPALPLQDWLGAGLRVLMVPDHGASPVPLVTDGTAAPDLSHAQLRCPPHEFRVGGGDRRPMASLFVPVIKDGRAWGLIHAHHPRPHGVPPVERALAAAVADAFSLGIDAAQAAAERAARAAHEAMHAGLLERIARTDDLTDALVHGPVPLPSLFDGAGGAAVVGPGPSVTTVGATPPADAVAAIVEWLRATLRDPVYATDALPTAFPDARPHQDTATGLLALSLGDEGQHFVLWFRPGLRPGRADGDSGRATSRVWPAWTIDLARGLRAALTDRLLRQMRRQAERHLQLEEDSRVKLEFLTKVSHELRTPLNAIIGFSEFLLDADAGPLNDRQCGFVRNIKTSGTHLLELINDVLDLSKIEAGRLDLQDEDLDVAIAIGEVHTLQEPALAGAGLRFDAVLPRPLPHLRGDRRALRQMLLNLVSNAVKFTPPDGQVVVEVARGPSGLDITVADTGIGIAREHHRLVLEPFRQAPHDQIRNRTGTGLGLAIVRSLIEAHGGGLELESAPGLGTRVTLHFPPDRVLV